MRGEELCMIIYPETRARTEIQVRANSPSPSALCSQWKQEPAKGWLAGCSLSPGPRASRASISEEAVYAAALPDFVPVYTNHPTGVMSSLKSHSEGPLIVLFQEFSHCGQFIMQMRPQSSLCSWLKCVLKDKMVPFFPLQARIHCTEGQ